MLKIYHSNHLDVLKDLLVELLRRNPPTNPLADEQILVQSPGMAQWLRLELAKGLGIAAGINFPLPASFLWQLYTRVLADVPQRSAFNKESMTWKLMDLLDTVNDDPDFASLTSYLASDEDDIRKFQLAGKIADIFDQYLVYRPDWILEWERGQKTTAEQPWQPKLWQKLVQRTAQLGQSPWHRANMHHRFLATMSDGSNLAHLPERLFVFGISALPPHFVESLDALSNHCEVHLLVANPSQHYWGDLCDPKHLRKMVNKKLTNKTDNSQKVWFSKTDLLDNPDTIGNPLLLSMGKLGRDYFHQLHGLDAFDVDVFVNNHPDNLLGLIQKDIFDLHNRTDPGQQTPQSIDPSLQFHSCHSPLRELEVLHDHLLNLFANNTELTPKDIVIMLPDIDSYTPWIQAVFGSVSDHRRIPYAISDVSAKREHPILAAILRLLELDKSRCSAPELMELLEVPAILARFKLTPNDLTTLRQWTHESGIRWGLTPTHQSDFGLPKLQANSWLFGIRRMLMGYAMPESTGVYDDILPFDAVQGMSAVLAGSLASFIDAAEQLLQMLTQNRPIEQWIQFTHQLLDDFFTPQSEEDETALQLVQQNLTHLYEQLHEAGYQRPLSRSVFISYLSERLTQERGSQRFLAGQVNFCTLMPMRSIPFKVVCLLGMNDGAYPRSIAPVGFDLIARNTRRGDRSRRVDDRYLFLEALLSAQDTLYISFVGRRIQDNSERVPSVLVTELLNYCEQGFGLKSTDLVVEHPLQPFSPSQFLPPPTMPCAAPFYTYTHEWLPAARRDADSPPPFIEQPLPENTNTQEIELAELLRFYRNPCEYFFNRRLKVYFSNEGQALEETETFILGGLEDYHLKTDILDSLINDEPIDDLTKRLRSTGDLPHCAFGELSLEDHITAMATMAEKLKEQRSPTTPDQEVNLEIPDHQGQPQQLTGWLRGFSDTEMLRYRPADLKGKDLIRYWIEHLCLCMTKQPKTTRIYDLKKEYQLNIVPKELAEQHLTTLIHHFQQGQTRPLPWFAKTAWAWLSVDDEAKAKKSAEKAFAGDGYRNWGESNDEYIRRAYPELAPVFNEMTHLTEKILAPAQAYLEEITP